MFLRGDPSEQFTCQIKTKKARQIRAILGDMSFIVLVGINSNGNYQF